MVNIIKVIIYWIDRELVVRLPINLAHWLFRTMLKSLTQWPIQITLNKIAFSKNCHQSHFWANLGNKGNDYKLRSIELPGHVIIAEKRQGKSEIKKIYKKTYFLENLLKHPIVEL